VASFNTHYDIYTFATCELAVKVNNALVLIYMLSIFCMRIKGLFIMQCWQKSLRVGVPIHNPIPARETKPGEAY
jgi:hypothetical protein